MQSLTLRWVIVRRFRTRREGRGQHEPDWSCYENRDDDDVVENRLCETFAYLTAVMGLRVRAGTGLEKVTLAALLADERLLPMTLNEGDDELSPLRRTPV